MTRQKKTARARAAFNFNTRLQLSATEGNLSLSKQLQPAMTNQLYTILITNCDFIGKPYCFVVVTFCLTTSVLHNVKNTHTTGCSAE